jgi:hypothetical protein
MESPFGIEILVCRRGYASDRTPGYPRRSWLDHTPGGFASHAIVRFATKTGLPRQPMMRIGAARLEAARLEAARLEADCASIPLTAALRKRT